MILGQINNMSKFTKFLGGTAVALTLMAGATQASAALITQWGYEVQAGFSAFGPVAPDQNAAPNDSDNNGVVGSNPNAGIGGLPTTISWGLGANGGPSSSLSVTPSVTPPPNLFTNAGPVAGASITHANNVITGGSLSLESATLATTLSLTPVNPAGSTIGPIPIIFSILFQETPNGGVDGVCTPGTGGTPCADIFVLDNPGALSFDLLIDEFIYTVELLVDGLGVLSDEACAAADEVAGCVGFITPENQTSTLDTAFRISARPVAEPGTLALLGLGLLGLGIARRRKAAA